MLTERQIELVQNSFWDIVPVSEHAAALFYGRLFELDPSLRKLFHVNMDEQGRKLMKMLAVAVHNLDQLGEIIPAVEALGRRHSHYGVREQDYDTVGLALLWTLNQALGERFTRELEIAWTQAYAVLATTAIHASEAIEVAV
jgi:hemoglobin-like flavoprotein